MFFLFVGEIGKKKRNVRGSQLKLQENTGLQKSGSSEFVIRVELKIEIKAMQTLQ